MSDWPPPFTIRRHPRAKHARLRIDPHRGLEVVLPKGIPDFFADDLLHQRRDWIRQHWDQVIRKPNDDGPDHISVRQASRIVSVEYASRPARSWLGLNKDSIRVDADRWQEALQAWLKAEARRTLSPRLEELAETHDFNFKRTRIGLQRSRWGSYSNRGTISLNAALLLVDSPLADHVMLHELCHTEHMHHGPAFYRRLNQADPAGQNHHQALRQSWRELPAWLWHRS